MHVLPHMMSLLLLIIIILLTNSFCSASASSSCGDIANISCPFYLRGQPHKCHSFSYELTCENNNRTKIQISYFDFYVEAINYVNSSVRILDSGLDTNNCSSIPVYHFYNRKRRRHGFGTYSPIGELSRPVTYIDCPDPVKSSSSRYIPTPPCSSISSVSSYVVIGHMNSSEVENNCTIRKTNWVSSAWPDINKTSFLDIQNMANYGIELPFHYLHCLMCDAPRSLYCRDVKTENADLYCSVTSTWSSILWYSLEIIGLIWAGWSINLILVPLGFGSTRTLVMALGARYLCGIAFLSVFMIYKLRRRHLSAYDSIEDFLQGPNNLMPIRYSYSQIKKFTKGFNDKLGEGGFGTVYKGKLRSGLLVAVKILSNSKASGQDFINEVGTIGRIHHVSIVRLIGFCVEGSKRALIYEFMPNGSLDKYIFPEKDGGEVGTTTLSCEKIYEISCKVACGIEYLHRGCDMQILHFDIKPHNILLDKNINPKISDFGLAKLRATDDSIVTMTAARGTMGYMAPELFYKNIGGVSNKADVYSFGMLLMEMAGKRKNLNPFVNESSQIYFPSWIYDQISKGKEIEMEHATDNQKELIKKMIIVAMWCIQMKPTERPPMNKVIEMLEGDLKLLVMPPKPLICPQEPPSVDEELNLTSSN